jgi:hypothetical protein
MAGRQQGLVVQHAEQPLVQIREWVTKRLKHLLGFDEVDGLVNNLMSFQSAEETEKYIKALAPTPAPPSSPHSPPYARFCVDLHKSLPPPHLAVR